MKTWYDFFLLCLMVAAVFITFTVFHGFNLILAIIYAVLLLTGFAVCLVIPWLEKMREIEFPGYIKILLFCPICKECIPLISENNAPIYEDGKKRQIDDYNDFLKRHRGHAGLLKYLSIVWGPWRKTPVGEPTKNELFIAKGIKGDKGIFLLKRSRSNIRDQLRYKAFPVWHPGAFACFFGWFFCWR